MVIRFSVSRCRSMKREHGQLQPIPWFLCSNQYTAYTFRGFMAQRGKVGGFLFFFSKRHKVYSSLLVAVFWGSLWIVQEAEHTVCAQWWQFLLTPHSTITGCSLNNDCKAEGTPLQHSFSQKNEHPSCFYYFVLQLFYLSHLGLQPTVIVSVNQLIIWSVKH